MVVVGVSEGEEERGRGGGEEEEEEVEEVEVRRWVEAERRGEGRDCFEWLWVREGRVEEEEEEDAE